MDYLKTGIELDRRYMNRISKQDTEIKLDKGYRNRMDNGYRNRISYKIQE